MLREAYRQQAALSVEYAALQAQEATAKGKCASLDAILRGAVSGRYINSTAAKRQSAKKEETSMKAVTVTYHKHESLFEVDGQHFSLEEVRLLAGQAGDHNFKLGSARLSKFVVNHLLSGKASSVQVPAWQVQPLSYEEQGEPLAGSLTLASARENLADTRRQQGRRSQCHSQPYH